MTRKGITDVEVCEAYAEMDRQRGDGSVLNDYEFPYEILMRRTGESYKVCYRAMECAEGHGYVESGVSLRTGWLTKKGKMLLAGG